MMFRKRNSKSSTQHASVWTKALWLLFSSERSNSYKAVENRRGTPAFPLVDIEKILCIQGRKLEAGNEATSSVHQQKEHLLFGEGERQQTSYCVPVLSPYSALGVAVAESLHDKMCGASAASTMARGSQFFHFTRTLGPLLKKTCLAAATYVSVSR